MDNTKNVLRLDKFLSHSGAGSRKNIKSILKRFDVSVNGVRAKSVGVRIDPKKDIVTIDGEQITVQEHVYYAFNKPLGVITTTQDPQGRETVMDYVDTFEKVHPIGRLDRDTHGLLILTNDGELTHKVIHPKFHVPKTYILTVKERPIEEQMHSFRTGVLLRDGITRPAEIEIVHSDLINDQEKDDLHKNTTNNQSLLRVTIHEGKNRQIRRMCATLGIELIDLKRISFGPIMLDDLPEGEYRSLTNDEIDALKSIAGK